MKTTGTLSCWKETKLRLCAAMGCSRGDLPPRWLVFPAIYKRTACEIKSPPLPSPSKPPQDGRWVLPHNAPTPPTCQQRAVTVVSSLGPLPRFNPSSEQVTKDWLRHCQ